MHSPVKENASQPHVRPSVDPFRGAPVRSLGSAGINAHHGEIIQGVFYTTDGTLEHGLVTLPCSLFSARAQFRPMRSGPLTVNPADCRKALLAARLTLDALGRPGWGGSLSIESSVPLCWGCGSSTTDVLTTIRAVGAAFHIDLQPEWIARLCVASETASDSLMYEPDRAVLFAQRRGSVLLDLGGALPHVRVVGLNTQPQRRVSTLSLPPCSYSSWEIEAFQPLLGLLRKAIERGDASLMGRVATASTDINQRHRPKPFMSDLKRIAGETGALGIQVAHSGTVAGLLYEALESDLSSVNRAIQRLRELGHKTWEFQTSYPIVGNTP